MTNDLQASSKIAELACDLRALVGGTRLEFVTSSVSVPVGPEVRCRNLAILGGD
jgi:hypothetical protein